MKESLKDSLMEYPDNDGDEKNFETDTPDGSSLRALMEHHNIAETLSDEDLEIIGQHAKRGYDTDHASRSDWERDTDEWTKLASQVREAKNYPWPRASNVKYPLLSTAAMQFAARAYPSLVPSNGKVVQSQVIGDDPDGTKLDLAHRVDQFMSYQIMHEMKGWEEDMDKLLIMLPIVGCMFKKTYWDPVCKENVSRLVMPKNLVVNYWARCLETAERISERLEISPRLVEERMRSGLFLRKEIGPPSVPNTGEQSATKVRASSTPPQDETTPYVFIEQHTYLDLDGDDYKEPYIVTFDLGTGTVVRITARYDDSTMYFNDKGDLLKIEPIEYYTKFSFVPNPDGGFYDIGFGMLLGPLNEAVNTNINQLTDAGTLANMQGGFMGKGLRLKMGEQRFQPGEWKPVNATGDDLRKQIVPLPTKDPSSTLFQLMGSLITSGKELASVAEIFTGKMPGQNTPATTTMATVEQGMKVFTAVYKRIFRALDAEFLKIFKLNATYLNPNTYQQGTALQVGPEDFRPDGDKGYVYKICPGADPTAVSQSEKLMKAQGLLELLPTGVLNVVEVVQRVLDAQEQPNWQKLLNPQVAQTGSLPPPPPDPKMLELQMKGQMQQQAAQLDSQGKQQDMELKGRDAQMQLQMKAATHAQDMSIAQDEANAKMAEAHHKNQALMASAQTKLQTQKAADTQKLQHKQAEHQQKLKHQPKKGT